MPKPHHFPSSYLYLVSKNLPLAKIIAPDLNARIPFVPTKLQPEYEIGRFATPPNQPILSFRFARTPNFSIANFPSARLAVPTLEILAIEQKLKARFISAERNGKNEIEGEKQVLHHNWLSVKAAKPLQATRKHAQARLSWIFELVITDRLLYRSTSSLLAFNFCQSLLPHKDPPWHH